MRGWDGMGLGVRLTLRLRGLPSDKAKAASGSLRRGVAAAWRSHLNGLAGVGRYTSTVGPLGGFVLRQTPEPSLRRSTACISRWVMRNNIIESSVHLQVGYEK